MVVGEFPTILGNPRYVKITPFPTVLHGIRPKQKKRIFHPDHLKVEEVGFIDPSLGGKILEKLNSLLVVTWKSVRIGSGVQPVEDFDVISFPIEFTLLISLPTFTKHQPGPMILHESHIPSQRLSWNKMEPENNAWFACPSESPQICHSSGERSKPTSDIPWNTYSLVEILIPEWWLIISIYFLL